MAKIYLVEGEHWNVPGLARTAHATKLSADTEAASLVNILRKDVGLPENATPRNWEARYQAARNARARWMGCDVANLGISDANVEVIELELRP